MRTRTLCTLALGAALLSAAPAAAQTIRTGMTADQVRATLGDPALVRSAGGWSYLFYSNGCAVRCGSDDVVFLQEGRVVAAVFRTRGRRFAGPGASRALEAAPGGTDPAPEIVVVPAAPAAGRGATGGRDEARETAPARVGGIRVQVPGTESVSTGGGEVIIRAGDARRDAEAQGPVVDAPLDAERQARERQVTPRTIPADRPGEVRPDTALDRRRQQRERQAPPRTIPPDTTRRP
jgi:hypothetical protein